MTHDPLCPNIPEDWDGKILWPSRCDCVLIAKVRADEQQGAIKRSLDDISADLDGLPALRIIWSICPDMDRMDWGELEAKYPLLFGSEQP